jgi:hypothetical protein
MASERMVRQGRQPLRTRGHLEGFDDPRVDPWTLDERQSPTRPVNSSSDPWQSLDGAALGVLGKLLGGPQ